MKFRAYLEAAEGKRAVELLTVAPGQQGERTDTSVGKLPKSNATHQKEKVLRAITRAPELVQDLYRQGKISQTTAAPRRATKPVRLANRQDRDFDPQWDEVFVGVGVGVERLQQRRPPGEGETVTD